MLGVVSVTAAPVVAALASGAIHRREIKPGLTPAEVRALRGEPREEVVSDRRVPWPFPDCSVTFEDGKVVEVRL